MVCGEEYENLCRDTIKECQLISLIGIHADELVKTLKRFGVETSLIKTNNYCKMHGLPMRRKVR